MYNIAFAVADCSTMPRKDRLRIKKEWTYSSSAGYKLLIIHLLIFHLTKICTSVMVLNQHVKGMLLCSNGFF